MSVSDSTGVMVVMTTMPNMEAARALVTSVVSEELAACGNVIPGVVSLFRWEGELTKEDESLVLLKTASERAEALCARLSELHPYSVPEVLGLDVSIGSQAYLSWVRGEVGA